MSLAVDDINVGDKITVLSCLYNPCDRSYKGEVLTVLAVDLPFLIVDGPYRYLKRISLDVREWQFKRCSDKFVQAAKAAGGGND